MNSFKLKFVNKTLKSSPIELQKSDKPRYKYLPSLGPWNDFNKFKRIEVIWNTLSVCNEVKIELNKLPQNN